MKPFFSIVIPTLNEELYLPKLLGELEKQTEKDFEIIIVDSSSTDKTAKVAHSFKDLPITFFEKLKKNVSTQRNFGASKATGTYLVFLDADSGIFSTFLSRTHAYITKKKGLVFLPAMLPFERNAQIKLLFQFVNFFVETSQNFDNPFSTGGSIVIERNFFNHMGGFNEKLFISEDHDLIQRAHAWGVKAKLMRKIPVKFSLRRMKKEGQLTLLYKYLIASTHVLLKNKVKKKLFEYEMGGHHYEADAKKPESAFPELLSKVRELFIDLLKE